MKSAFRLLGLTAALVVALASVSYAQGNDIVPIRDSPNLLKHYRWIYMGDYIRPPLSYLDSSHPFKAIAVDVQWTANSYVPANDLDGLRDFAIHAMRSRLQELNVADQVMVFAAPRFEWGGEPPQGLSYCDVFHVAFRLTATPPALNRADEGAVAMTMVAYQPAENDTEPAEQRCVRWESRPSWVLHDGPRLFIVNPNQREAILAQAREQALLVIDQVLIWDAIIRSNETARRSFNKIVFGRE
jgi:hypothetical protein